MLNSKPGVYDGISARLALEAGFDVLYMSGAATTASMLGQPDLAIATQNDFIQVNESTFSPEAESWYFETECHHDCRS